MPSLDVSASDGLLVINIDNFLRKNFTAVLFIILAIKINCDTDRTHEAGSKYLI